MFGGSLRNYWMLRPPFLQLLNFPSHQQQEQIPRQVVQFECPPGHRLSLRPRRLRSPAAVPDGEGAIAQVPRNGPSTEALILTKIIPPNEDLMMAGFICAMVSLLFLFFLCLGAKLRKFYWFSFILAVLFAEFAGLGVILVLLDRTWLPKIVLPGEAAMLLLLVVFSVASVFVMTMFIFTDNWIYGTVYFFIMAIMLVPTCLYHSQVVHGRRFRLPVHEFVICAVHDFDGMDNIYHQDSVRATVMELDPMTQFIRSIYSQGLIIIFATVGAWLLLLVTNVHLHRYLPFPVYVLAITIFLTMIAYGSPWKWIMVSLVVLCTTVLGCSIIDKLSTLNISLVMLGVALIILVLNFSGAKCPLEFLPGGVCSTLLMLALLLALIVAQFNHGRLDIVEVMPREHLMICTLTLYLHTMMFFCCVCYFVLVTERKASTEPTTVTETDRKL
ncbi:hypothetical protein M5D96_005118 [Drosophila gunungcola]|uniref:Uncharacterized protein n=1 Tax=Drosophila gunungcola TaxID=103775 RepID=A0A9P9YV82_9MUSC|nr:hypothetical protein M5D96_005118 [Drosophila gunungcola]